MEFNMNYVKDFMLEILNIPSVGGNTKVALNRVKEEFQSMGIEVKATKKGAIIGVFKGEDNENQKMICAHIDTLGAMVKEIKPNGRLKLSNIGGFSWNSVEGENLIIKTSKGFEYTGNLLPEKASVHIHPEEARELIRTEENMEVRIDEDVNSLEDTLRLGIKVGDFVTFETRTSLTNKGYIKSRYLDDKACVAIIFGVCKYLKDNNIKPKNTILFYISNYEEIGHGVSIIPEEVYEFLALDIGTVGIGHTADEHSVCISAKDNRTPYDFEFRNKLVEMAEEEKLNYKVDVYYRYASDASMTVLRGADVNFACIGPGVDATHHYERTHIDSIENTMKLIVKYITR